MAHESRYNRGMDETGLIRERASLWLQQLSGRENERESFKSETAPETLWRRDERASTSRSPCIPEESSRES